MAQEYAESGVLSEKALAHLKTYKYSSVDKSPLTHYVLRHYWNGFVHVLPMWLAPNMVTLIGFGFIIANIILLIVYIPDLVGPAPSWVYYSFAFGLWMYSTMDNVDGKQARRTGTSSGLGELFDHGIDSLNCTLGSLLETAAMGLGATRTGAFTALVPCLPMFFSTWETYHSHTLYLGYFNGPTEGLVIACTIMILSGWYGPQMWHIPVGQAFELPSILSFIGPYSVRDMMVTQLIVAFGVAHLPACVLNVWTARNKQNLPLLPTLAEWTPMIVYTVATAAWLGSPYSRLLPENHLVLFCITQSFVFGRMTTKIILAHLTRQPFPYWTVVLAPLVGGAVLTNLPTFGFSPVLDARSELLYLWAYLGFSIVVYSRWAVLVISAITQYLGINCLTIPRQIQLKNAANGKRA